MDKDPSMSTLKGALILPFAPRRGFTAVHNNSGLWAAAIAVFLPTVVAEVLLEAPSFGYRPLPWPDFVNTLAYLVLIPLLLYPLLVWISTVLMSRRGSKTDYLSSAKVLGFWIGWFFVLTTILRLLLPDNFLTFTAVRLLLVLWFLGLLAIALSVVHDYPLRGTWFLAFASLALSGLVVYAITLGAAVIYWSVT